MQNGHGKEFWEGLVREVFAGESQVAVARRHGVSRAQLGKWCRRMGSEVAQPLLLPVRCIEVQGRRLDLTVGRARVSFDEGTEPEYVARIARALAS